jgi:phage shock protein C
MTAAPGLDTPADIPEPSSVPAERRFLRSRTNRVLAGVCGGIAEYYGSDVNAIRLVAVLIAIFTGIVPLLVAYLVAAILLPERAADGSIPDQAQLANPSARGAGLVFGVLLIAVGALALANEVLLVDWDLLWPVALIVLGGVLLLAASSRR